MEKKKTYDLCLRLAEDEAQTLEINAKKCGLSKSVYLRQLIMNTPIKERPTKELHKLYTEINYIGNNINQIARAVNAGFATEVDIRKSTYLLGKIYELVHNFDAD